MYVHIQKPSVCLFALLQGPPAEGPGGMDWGGITQNRLNKCPHTT